uniref:Uncharacterized protein n=2 Tax=Sus scrofa TaxID=9823 RepID=A0A4X1W773_PIG
MASLSKLTFSGKVLTEPQNGGNMAFLDMSLDDIIILRKIEDTSTEEIKDGAENHLKNNSVSRRRSNTRKHRRQRGEMQ